MFKKARPKHQIKRSIHDEDDTPSENTTSTPSETPAIQATKAAVVATKPVAVSTKPTNSLLSFDEEEESTVFKVKKNTQKSRSLRIPSISSSSSFNQQSIGQKDSINTQVPTIGEYSAERLQQLRESQAFPLRMPSARPATESIMEDSTTEELIKTAADIEAEEAADDDLAAYRIPSADQIRRAKERRERQRGMGFGVGSADYVPLKSEDDVPMTGKYAETGIIKEDETDRDVEVFEDQQGSRIRMSTIVSNPLASGIVNHDANQPAAPLPITAAAMESAGVDGDEDLEEEAEIEEWEREQFKKAGVKSTLIRETDASKKAKRAARRAEFMSGPTRTDPRSVVFGDPDAMLQDIQKKMEGLQSVQSARRQQLDKINGDVTSAEEGIKILEVKFTSISEQFQFFQQMRDFTSDLADCLDEKAPLILDAESALVEMEKEFSQRRSKRRFEDFQDELEESGAVVTVKTEPMVDEFGRDKSFIVRQEKTKRKERREKRRERKRQKLLENRSHRFATAADEEEEIYATTDDDEDEEEEFVSNRLSLIQEAKKIFEDVAEDYKSVSFITEKFALWKRKFPKAYRDAFCSATIPDLLEPYVRLSSLTWDPLCYSIRSVELTSEPALPNPSLDSSDRVSDLRNLGWYNVLYDYGVDKESAVEDSNDPDLDLLPNLITKVLYPRAKEIITNIWRTDSRRQTKIVFHLVEELAVYPPPDSPVIQELLSTVLRRLEEAVESIQLPSNSMLMTPFTRRQLLRLVKLVENIVIWNPLLAPKTLQRLVFESILSKHIVSTSTKAPATIDNVNFFVRISEKLAAIIPPEWISSAVPPSLEAFASNLIRAIKLSNSTMGPSAAKSLITLRCLEQATALVKISNF